MVALVSKSVVQASGLNLHNGSAMGCEIFIRLRDITNIEKGELGYGAGLPTTMICSVHSKTRGVSHWSTM